MGLALRQPHYFLWRKLYSTAILDTNGSKRDPFHFQNEKEFRRQLRIVRSQQMGFLSAASMESGSYQRGYEHIVRYT